MPDRALIPSGMIPGEGTTCAECSNPIPNNTPGACRLCDVAWMVGSRRVYGERVIWRFPLTDTKNRDVQPIDNVEMPAGATVLSVAIVDNSGWVFAEVSPGAPKVLRHLWVVGTGKAVPPGARFLGTLISPPFNWHVYDGGEAIHG